MSTPFVPGASEVPLNVCTVISYRKQAVEDGRVVLAGEPIVAIITELDLVELGPHRYIVETEAGWVDSVAEAQILEVLS